MADDGSIFDGSNEQLAAIPSTDPGMQPKGVDRQPPPPNPQPKKDPEPKKDNEPKKDPELKTPATSQELDDEDIELQSEVGQTVIEGTERKLMDEDKNDDKENKKKAALLLFLCLAFIGVLIALILFFRPDTGAAARGQIDDTLAPSRSPTYFPTEATDAPTLAPVEEVQTTLAPTRFPTRSPTPEDGPTPFPTTASPTLFPSIDVDPDVPISRLPCAEIKTQANVTEGTFGENNFKLYPVGDKEVCGDTFGGTDPARPLRSHWSVSYGRRDCPALNFLDGFALCDHVGARWCTLEEYVAGVALGTGCGGDRQHVWTSNKCVSNGQPGRVMFDLGLRDPKQPFTKCEPDLNTLSPIRCCGDNY